MTTLSVDTAKDRAFARLSNEIAASLAGRFKVQLPASTLLILEPGSPHLYGSGCRQKIVYGVLLQEAQKVKGGAPLCERPQAPLLFGCKPLLKTAADLRPPSFTKQNYVNGSAANQASCRRLDSTGNKCAKSAVENTRVFGWIVNRKS